jgi:ribonuclease D
LRVDWFLLWRVIDQDNQLEELLPRLAAAPWIAVDTEADSLHAYPEKLCLLQISLPGEDLLVDPLMPMRLTGLWETLQKRELILHGADYDLRLLHRRYRFEPHAIFDTMIAARLLGCAKFGLSDLVSQFLGLTLEKGPQKANWARRPLPERMVEYARNDTRYLKPLVDILGGQLEAKGRLQWQRESCQRLIATCVEPRATDLNTVWRLKGSHRLGRPALAVLRELWEWREREAIAANRPPYFVLSHEALVNLAAAAVSGKPLDGFLPRHFSPRRFATLSEAIRHALALAPQEHPDFIRTVHHHPSVTEQKCFERLRKKRDEKAAALEMDPTLIASRSTLELLARTDGVDTDGELMRWQAELLA